MSNPVTLRFIECFHFLRDRQMVPSARQFALSLSFHAQAFHKILKGERDVTLELLRKAVDVYHLNPDYLLRGEGDMITAPVGDSKIDSITQELPLLMESSRNQYVADRGKGEQPKNIPRLSIPRVDGQHTVLMAFEFRGHHLRPCIMDRDIVIGRHIEPQEVIEKIREGYVYIFVTDSEVLITRMIDWIDGGTRLLVVTPQHGREKHLVVELSQIVEVWAVCQKLTRNVPSPENVHYNTERKISNISEILEKQNATIVSLNATVEKLLKQNRATRI